MKKLVMFLICLSIMFALIGCSTYEEMSPSGFPRCGFSRCPGHSSGGDRCRVGFYPWPPGWFADWERPEGGIVLFMDGNLLQIE